MTVLTDMESVLVTVGVPDSDFTLTLGHLPDDQDRGVALYETPGGEPDQAKDINYDYPEVQLRVRGAQFGYAEAEAKWQAAFNALHNSTPTASWTYLYGRTSRPAVFYDDRDRPNFTSTFKGMRERT